MNGLSETAVPFSTLAEAGRRTLRQLDAPIVHAAGTVYRDTDFVVSPRFKSTSVRAAFYSGAGHVGVTFKNCTFRTQLTTWDRRWRKPALPDPMLNVFSCLRLAATTNLVIDGLHIEGFPEAAIACGGVVGASIKRLSIVRCLVGVTLSEPANRNWTVDFLRVADLWGPGPDVIPGLGSWPSRRHPGLFTGGDGFAGYCLDDVTMRHLEFTGDCYTGIKLARCKRVRLYNLCTPSLMLQGTQQRHSNNDGSTDGCEDVEIRSLFLDKRIGGCDGSEGANGMQVSWNVKGLDVGDFALLSGGKDGHGVQLWGDVAARFHDGVFEGWNGTRGGQPAYAMEIGDGSTVNADFETVNGFYDQPRVLLVRKP
jgi:hypothetical protein